MAYSVKIVKKELQKASEWSGGITTELFIYPENSDYKKRNFLWRLSSATVNLEESTFTHLREVQRLIMVLEGKMKLEHEGHHTIDLNPFEQDSFSGDWTTKSYGKVRDFNLMMKEGCKGKIEAIDLKDSLEIEIEHHQKDYLITTEAFYSLSDDVEIIVNNRERICLDNGDMMLIHIDSDFEAVKLIMTNKGNMNNKIIRSSIRVALK